MTVAIYIRVSTIEQATEGYSIAAQKERLLAYCRAQGWDNYKFYIDEGVSAKDTNRPELKNLFEDMRKQRINMILVYRLDRFTRRVVDFHRMLEEMNKYNCTFKSATEPYDTSSAMGRMFISLVATIAQWETENLSERIKMALEEKVSSGERVGNIPYGFNLDKNERLVKNEKSPILEDMVERIFDGWSMSKLSEYLDQTNNDGNWTVIKVKRLLTNPALYGATKWNNNVYENTHEGIMTKEKFIKLQELLRERSLIHRRDVSIPYLFQSVLACPRCGYITTTNRVIRNRVDGTEHVSVRYVCGDCIRAKRPYKSYGEETVLDGLYEYMKNVKLPSIKETPKPKKLSIYQEQLKQIEKKRKKYQRAWASDLMTDEEFTKLMNETKTAYEELKEKSKEKEEHRTLDIEVMKSVISQFNDNFKELTKEEQRRFIIRFIKKIEIKAITPPPKRPDKAKKGRDVIVVTNVVFR